MTPDEWAVAEEDAITRALRPLSERRARLLAVALVRSLHSLASGAVIANAIAVAGGGRRGYNMALTGPACAAGDGTSISLIR